MTDKAFLVGIEDYAERPLMAAVNDVFDMLAYVQRVHGVPDEHCRIRTDGSATRDEILGGLEWLLGDARPGDRRLFFFSGHGMQLPTLDPVVEPDGMDEAICPWDITPAGRNAIRDQELGRLFGPVPAGVSCVWISDSCSSRDLTNALGAARPGARSLPSPGGARGPLTGSMLRSARDLHVGMISACASDATAIERELDGRGNGALTFALLQELLTPEGRELPLSEVVTRVRRRLTSLGVSQSPDLEGDAAIKERPFWG